MEDHGKITEAAHALASAIAGRDGVAIADLLDTDFVLRTPGGQSLDAETFIAGIRGIPGEIAFVRLDDLQVDLVETGAVVTGVQHAQLKIEGQLVDERRPFVDWFVRSDDGSWRVRLALNLPAYAEG